MKLDDLINEIKSISENLNVQINLDISVNCNPSTGVYDTRYWLNAPKLDVSNYYDLEQVLKFIKVWKESVGVKDNSKQHANGAKLVV
jgi:hypothetical protein